MTRQTEGLIPLETVRRAAEICREAAGEGIVLLEDDRTVLPFEDGERVAVFGRIQIDTYYCGNGAGSGGYTPDRVSILDGLRQHPRIRVNETLAAVYEAWVAEHPKDPGKWASWPQSQEEMPIGDELVRAARVESETAVVVIGRSSGEDSDFRLEEGSYYLTDAEHAMLRAVTAHFERVVVLINAGNLMDVSWLDTYAFSAVLHVWMGGMMAGHAVADVLSGDVTPSGKLTSTVAHAYEQYPTAENFGQAGWESVTEYAEDIYVGYRYFETFAKEDVRYPFGYGLSYTDFHIESAVAVEQDVVTVKVRVTNTGRYAGKEVVQVYSEVPQGTLGQPLRQLVGYAKTARLAPGEAQSLCISFGVEQMASYDDVGKTGHRSAWVMESGLYAFYVGNSVRTAVKAGEWTLDTTRVVEQLEEASAVQAGNGFDRIVPIVGANGAYTVGRERVPEETPEADLAKRILARMPRAIPVTGDRGYRLIDVYRGAVTMDDFIAQLTPQELADIARGEFQSYSVNGANSIRDTQNAGSFGGVTASLRDKGIVAVATVDGPSGLVTGKLTALYPVAVMLACSFNTELVERLYQQMALEMLDQEVDVELGPGLNILRNPLLGRTYEYFAEDPLVAGMMGVASVRGLQRLGASANPKHFAANNQETWRRRNDSRVSERALREIYLRAFERCIKVGRAHTVMMSYNRVNGEWSHYNYDLATTILRREWGFTGVTMTDWQLQQGTSEQLGVSDNAYRVRAGVNVNMPGFGPGEYDGSADILAAYQTWVDAGCPTDRLVGLTLGEMQENARSVLTAVMDSLYFRTLHGLPVRYESGDEWVRVEAQ